MWLKAVATSCSSSRAAQPSLQLQPDHSFDLRRYHASAPAYSTSPSADANISQLAHEALIDSQAMRCLLQLPWLLASLALPATAKERTQGPGISTTSFTNTILGLTYFEDSNTILFPDLDTSEVWRSTDGGHVWKTIADVEDAVMIQKHPVDHNVAVILTGNTEHHITKDQGETWTPFRTPSEVNYMVKPVSFHASDPGRMLIHGVDCQSIFCEYPIYYTTDGFDSIELLHDNVRSCLWAKSTEQFSTGHTDQDKNRILCNIEGEYSFFLSDSQIFISDDFFKTKTEPFLDGDRAVNGIVEIASVTGYLAAAAKSAGSNELALYTTIDTNTWERATFGNHTVRENAYTLLESTNYSMQIDVLANSEPAMGVLFTSNSNGTFFTKSTDYYTNRDSNGYVDFEKVANIPGIVLVNKVANAEDIIDGEEIEKKIVTEISFDDGRTWHSLRRGKDDLHLHSVTDQRNIGRVFSSPAPGIIMGNGNTGKSLKGKLKDSDTFVSADAGLTWVDALEGPHMYEMGASGTVLVAVSSNMEKATDEVQWSTDYGRNWTTAKLEKKIRVTALTTTPDSTSLKFIIIAEKAKKDDEGTSEIIALDFSKLMTDKCSKDDFEDWPARVDEDGKAACLMGHTRVFRRRKPDSECIIDDEFHDIEPELENCKCKDEDYECDFGFVSVSGANSTRECHPIEPLQAPKGACTEDDSTYEGPSGYRLIPGNTCEQKGGVVKDKPVDRKCKETAAPPSGSVNSTITTATFRGKTDFMEYYYLERCEKCAGNDETIVVRTDEGTVFVTHDHGKAWEKLPSVRDKITAIFQHRYFKDRVYFLTSKKHVYVSEDRVMTIGTMDTPEAIEPRKGISFHPQQPDWLIYTGSNDDGRVAHYTKGGKWKKLLGGVQKCDFVYSDLRKNETDLVYCEQYTDEKHGKGELVLRGSKNWFEDDDDEPLRRNVVSFATMAEYIVVAVYDDDKNLKLDTSIDGKVFADAQFPRNFKVSHQLGYTVLDSSTHSVFVHVTVNAETGREYGSILKSSSNGTDYIMAISDVNRNEDAYVDYEKVLGIEGVAFANIVHNAGDVKGGEEKQLKTMMTFNDGIDWEFVRHKSDDEDCGEYSEDGQCSLHLHGFTERDDPDRTYSSATAKGILLAHGNVGEFLGKKKDADTYMSTDAGASWKRIQKGEWAYAFGDRGSVILIVEKQNKVTSVKYTLDEGANWQDHVFSEDEMDVDRITTVPSDTSLNFLLWGTIDGKLATVNIDFSGLKERSERCKMSDNEEDYNLWSVQREGTDNQCLFGHIKSYHRKKPESQCYNGPILPDFHDISKPCECTRADFECDYNYERQSDGTCKLVPGESALDPIIQCFKGDNITEYYDITGYRRIPMTTCEGGTQYEMTARSRPCPGFEGDFNRKHGISGIGLFFAIVLPIAAATAAGWYVWRHWDGKFGRIQLGDGAAGSRIGLGGAFDGDAPWIKYPVLALSGIIAVVMAIPMVVSTVWSAVSTRLGRQSGGRYGSYGGPRYTSRGSFQRGRGNYSVIDPDEGELLGDESEDEI